MPAPTGGGYPPRKLLPYKKKPVDLKSLARSYTDEATRVIAAIMRNGDKDAVRVQAAAILLDRGWGRAAQPHSGGDGEGAIQVVIRDLAEERRKAGRPMPAQTGGGRLTP